MKNPRTICRDCKYVLPFNKAEEEEDKFSLARCANSADINCVTGTAYYEFCTIINYLGECPDYSPKEASDGQG